MKDLRNKNNSRGDRNSQQKRNRVDGAMVVGLYQTNTNFSCPVHFENLGG